MKGENSNSPYSGIIPPLVTPLLDQTTLDNEGLARLIEHVLDGGVHGLFILGTTGEAPSLPYSLRKELIDRVCQQVDGRVPVLVGITDTAVEESITLAGHAAKAGAAAVVIAPPYYYPPAEPELLQYFQYLTARLPLPWFLYNMPGLTKISIGEDVIRWSVEQDDCLGLKDSSGSIMYYKRAIRLSEQRKDYRLLLGPEELLAESILAGGHGGVSGGANLFPSVFVDIYNAASQGDFAKASLLQRQSLEISERLYRIGKHSSAIIKGIKCALSLKGICSDVMAEPYQKMNPADRERVAKVLAELESMLESQVI